MDGTNQAKLLNRLAYCCALFSLFAGIYIWLALYFPQVFGIKWISLRTVAVNGTYCYMGSGIALIALLHGWAPWLQRGIGAALFAIAALSFVERLFSIDLRVDPKMSHPMWLMPAFSIMHVGLFFVLYRSPLLSRIKTIIFLSWGLFIVFFGVTGFLAHLFPILTQYIFPPAADTPVIAACIIVVLGSGMIASLISGAITNKVGLSKGIPFLLFEIVSILTLSLSFGIKAEKSLFINTLIEEEIEQNAYAIKHYLQNSTSYLSALQNLVVLFQPNDKATWTPALQQLLQVHPDLLIFEQVDASFKTSILLAMQKDHQGVNISSNFGTTAIQNIISGRTIQFFIFYDAMNNKEIANELITVLPYYENEKFNGATIASYNLQPLMQRILTAYSLEHFTITLRDGKQTLLQFNPIENPKKSPFDKSSNIDVDDLHWTLQYAPLPSFLKPRMDTNLFWISILGGLSVSLLTSFCFHLWVNAQKNYQQLHEVKQQLAKHQEQLSIALSAAQVGTWTWDLSLDQFYIDDHLHEILHIPTHVKIEKPNDFFTLFIKPKLNDLKQHLLQMTKSDRPTDLEYQLSLPGDGIRYIQSRGKIFYDMQGEPIRMTGVSWDTTELTTLSEKVKKSEKKFRSFIEATQDWIWEINAEGKIVYSSPGIASILGYSPEEVTGMNYLLLLDTKEEEKAKAYQEFQKCLQEKISWKHSPLQFRSKLDTRKWLEGTGIPQLDDEGNIVGFFGASDDVTVIKNIDRLKMQFIANVSHELRTPLTSIHGALGLLSADQNINTTPKLKELVEAAYRNSQKLIVLINDLLDTEKMEEGKMEYHFTEIKLIDIVKESIQTSRSLCETSHIQILLEEPTYDATVMADANRLIQVINNLLSNAIKFSYPNSVIDVSIIKENHNSVYVAVKDAGEGIAEDFKGKIFDRFAREGTLDRKPGSGIGLSLCKKIIEAHGGTIGFSSKKEIGSTFYFILPLANTKQIDSLEEK